MTKLRKWIIALVIVVLAAAAVLIGIQQYYLRQPGYLKGTTFNGEDIAGKTAEEVTDANASKYSTASKKVEIREKGEASIDTTLEALGYSFDRDSLEKLMDEAYEEQKHNVFTLLRTLAGGYEIYSDEAYTFDESKFDSVVASGKLKEPRVETEDPSIVLDESQNAYVVKSGVQGNMIDDAKLREAVRKAIDRTVGEGSIPDTIAVDIPDSVYTSVAPVGDEAEMKKEADAKTLAMRKQQILDKVKASSITYTFGSQTETLNSDTFMDWVSVDDSLNVVFNDDAVTNYVTQLSAKYNTRYTSRTFRTTGGLTVTIPDGDNEYGYTIAPQAEKAEIEKDLQTGQNTTREPVYNSTNDYGNPVYLAREGTDDLAGTYVEVDLTAQHMWFYKNGSLIVESDLVSGSVADGKQTKTGCFPLAWKQSPRTLTGDAASGSGSYSTEVQYWMPFYEGQGLHDANWRSSFGGDIYLTNGSHGCVNLPPAVAETIYNNIDVGTAIIIYNEDGSATQAG